MEEHRQKGRRLSADWGELQGMGSASQGAPSILSSSCMDDDRELYATACPESGAGNPLSDFERKCLKELNSYQILDTEPEAVSRRPSPEARRHRPSAETFVPFRCDLSGHASSRASPVRP